MLNSVAVENKPTPHDAAKIFFAINQLLAGRSHSVALEGSQIIIRLSPPIPIELTKPGGSAQHATTVLFGDPSYSDSKMTVQDKEGREIFSLPWEGRICALLSGDIRRLAEEEPTLSIPKAQNALSPQ